jgi:hypothetical protein
MMFELSPSGGPICRLKEGTQMEGNAQSPGKGSRRPEMATQSCKVFALSFSCNFFFHKGRLYLNVFLLQLLILFNLPKLIKKKKKFSSYIRNSDGICCKVIYEEGLPKI